LPFLLLPGNVGDGGAPAGRAAVLEVPFWPDLYLDGRRPLAGGWLP